MTITAHLDWPDAYLERLGIPDRRLPATPDTLERLHLAHLETVPFENLSILAGERIRLDPDWLYEKIVVRRRGGFCYELNGLFAELLAALGYGVELLAARVVRDDGTLGIPLDHMCLRVDGTWLADVGFGDSTVQPLRLDDPAPQSDGRRTFRIVDDGPGARFLEDAGHPVFRFELAPLALADFTPGCDYHQTSPDSHFTRRRVVSRLTRDGRVTLRDDRLITTDAAGHKTETPIDGDASWRQAGVEHFGLVAP